MCGATAYERSKTSMLGRYACLSIGRRLFRWELFLKRKSGEGLGWAAIGADNGAGDIVRFEVSARRSVFLQGGKPLSIAKEKPMTG